MKQHELVLRVSYGKKTWLARIIGRNAKFGFSRDFVNSVESNLSRSGKTGYKTYLVTAGDYYESEDAGDRRYWRADDEGLHEIDRSEVDI